jgi:hypothetical protein
MRWRSWLRHCATNRKVAGSIPDGVIGIFHWHNPFDRTMTLGSTQPLTEMSTRNISWPLPRADNLTTFKGQLSRNLGTSTSWNPKGLSRPVMGLLYLYWYESYWRKWCVTTGPSLLWDFTWRRLVTNYQPTPVKIPEERRPQLHRARSLKSDALFNYDSPSCVLQTIIKERLLNNILDARSC